MPTLKERINSLLKGSTDTYYVKTNHIARKDGGEISGEDAIKITKAIASDDRDRIEDVLKDFVVNGYTGNYHLSSSAPMDFIEDAIIKGRDIQNADLRPLFFTTSKEVGTLFTDPSTKELDIYRAVNGDTMKDGITRVADDRQRLDIEALPSAIRPLAQELKDNGRAVFHDILDDSSSPRLFRDDSERSFHKKYMDEDLARETGWGVELSNSDRYYEIIGVGTAPLYPENETDCARNMISAVEKARKDKEGYKYEVEGIDEYGDDIGSYYGNINKGYGNEAYVSDYEGVGKIRIFSPKDVELDNILLENVASHNALLGSRIFNDPQHVVLQDNWAGETGEMFVLRKEKPDVVLEALKHRLESLGKDANGKGYGLEDVVIGKPLKSHYNEHVSYTPNAAAADIAIRQLQVERNQKRNFMEDMSSRLGEGFSWHADPDNDRTLIDLNTYISQNGRISEEDTPLVDTNVLNGKATRINVDDKGTHIDVVSNGKLISDLPFDKLTVSAMNSLNSFVSGVEFDRKKQEDRDREARLDKLAKENKDVYYVPVMEFDKDSQQYKDISEGYNRQMMPGIFGGSSPFQMAADEFHKHKGEGVSDAQSIVKDGMLANARQGVPYTSYMPTHEDIAENKEKLLVITPDKIVLFNKYSAEGFKDMLKSIPGIQENRPFLRLSADTEKVLDSMMENTVKKENPDEKMYIAPIQAYTADAEKQAMSMLENSEALVKDAALSRSYDLKSVMTLEDFEEGYKSNDMKVVKDDIRQDGRSFLVLDDGEGFRYVYEKVPEPKLLEKVKDEYDYKNSSFPDKWSLPAMELFTKNSEAIKAEKSKEIADGYASRFGDYHFKADNLSYDSRDLLRINKDAILTDEEVYNRAVTGIDVVDSKMTVTIARLDYDNGDKFINPKQYKPEEISPADWLNVVGPALDGVIRENEERDKHAVNYDSGLEVSNNDTLKAVLDTELEKQGEGETFNHNLVLGGVHYWALERDTEKGFDENVLSQYYLNPVEEGADRLYLDDLSDEEKAAVISHLNEENLLKENSKYAVQRDDQTGNTLGSVISHPEIPEREGRWQNSSKAVNDVYDSYADLIQWWVDSEMYKKPEMSRHFSLDNDPAKAMIYSVYTDYKHFNNPVFLSEKEIADYGLKLKLYEPPFPIVEGTGKDAHVVNMYNLDQTDIWSRMFNDKDPLEVKKSYRKLQTKLIREQKEMPFAESKMHEVSDKLSILADEFPGNEEKFHNPEYLKEFLSSSSKSLIAKRHAKATNLDEDRDDSVSDTISQTRIVPRSNTPTSADLDGNGIADNQDPADISADIDQKTKSDRGFHRHM